jgi:hypothetical protein
MSAYESGYLFGRIATMLVCLVVVVGVPVALIWLGVVAFRRSRNSAASARPPQLYPPGPYPGQPYPGQPPYPAQPYPAQSYPHQQRQPEQRTYPPHQGG